VMVMATFRRHSSNHGGRRAGGTAVLCIRRTSQYCGTVPQCARAGFVGPRCLAAYSETPPLDGCCHQHRKHVMLLQLFNSDKRQLWLAVPAPAAGTIHLGRSVHGFQCNVVSNFEHLLALCCICSSYVWRPALRQLLPQLCSGRGTTVTPI
jgi:hypothetical protein